MTKRKWLGEPVVPHEAYAQMLLMRKEAARALGVGVRTFDKIVDAGVLKPVRLRPGGRRYYRSADVAKLAEKGCEDGHRKSRK